MGVSDYTLRESLADEIDKLINYSRGGAKGTRAGTPTPDNYDKNLLFFSNKVKSNIFVWFTTPAAPV